MNTLIRAASTDTPETALTHLSYSRISRYLLCPEQYRLYYIEGLRPKVPPGSLEFGKTVHQALAAHFSENRYPVAAFRDLWGAFQGTELRYSYRETWETLHERGQLLLERFLREELPRLGNVEATEKTFELSISNLDVPFVGVIDLVASLDGKRTVIDFKTASSSYDEHEVALSDQLTAYQLAEPMVAQCALCVFVKTKEPRIEWYISRRSNEQFRELLAKAEIVGQDIVAGRFYKRTGKHCAWCDYLPLCMGDRAQVDASLISLK